MLFYLKNKSMKQLIFFLFLFFYAGVFSQTNIADLERTDGFWRKKGTTIPYTGTFEEFYESGKLKGTGSFKDGLVDGLRIMYNEDGTKRVERQYSGGLSHGLSSEFYDDGKLKQEGEFVKGKENGIWTIYWKNGQTKSIITFENGVAQGDYFEFNEDGKLIKQFFLQDGNEGYSTEFLNLTSQALELSRQNKNREAIELYDKAILLNPTVAQVYFNRGVCKGQMFDFEGSIKDYDLAIEFNPEYKEAYSNRGNDKINIYTSKGNLKPTEEQVESACEDLHKAVELGEKAQGIEDLIFVYCKGQNKK
jgi:antitoxin component YwqK of YwqJK toxin-antitoxin module